MINRIYKRTIMINQKNKNVSVEDVESALRHYVRFHLKPGDVETVPELKRFLNSKDNEHSTAGKT